MKEKLDDAKNVIKYLQESLDEKVIEINTIQMAKAGEVKFTTETQTSLQEELALDVSKFSKEKNASVILVLFMYVNIYMLRFGERKIWVYFEEWMTSNFFIRSMKTYQKYLGIPATYHNKLGISQHKECENTT